MRLVAQREGDVIQEKLKNKYKKQKLGRAGGVDRKKRVGRPALNQRRVVAVDK